MAVKPAGATQLDDSRVESIRYLVAGAMAGLQAENVTVADLNSGKISHGDPEQGGLVGENLFAAVTKQHEQILKAKILEALAYIPNLTVTTTVILNREKSSRSLSVKNDPKTIPRRVVEQTKSHTRDSGAAGGGRPGAASQVANGPTALASASGSGKAGHEDEEESNSEQDNSLNTDPGGERDGGPDAHVGPRLRGHSQQLFRERVARAEPGEGGRRAEAARRGRLGPDPRRGLQQRPQARRPRCCRPKAPPPIPASWSRSPPSRTSSRARFPRPRCSRSSSTG